jgi:hypothetical protein
MGSIPSMKEQDRTGKEERREQKKRKEKENPSLN